MHIDGNELGLNLVLQQTCSEWDEFKLGKTDQLMDGTKFSQSRSQAGAGGP